MKSEAPHGTTTRYQRAKCRCDACRAAQRGYMRTYRARAMDSWLNKKRGGTCIGGLGWPAELSYPWKPVAR